MICGASANIVAAPNGLDNDANVLAKTRCVFGNQTAANFAGKYITKGWAHAANVCPTKVNKKRHSFAKKIELEA